MLQEMEKRLISRIYDLISRIDTAVSVMEDAVRRITARREYDDPQIEILKRFIMDLNFCNRTYIDGQVIPSNIETLIEYGSKIMLADEEFEFHCC